MRPSQETELYDVVTLHLDCSTKIYSEPSYFHSGTFDYHNVDMLVFSKQVLDIDEFAITIGANIAKKCAKMFKAVKFQSLPYQVCIVIYAFVVYYCNWMHP